MKSAFAAILLAACGSAAACDRYDVAVLPFEVREDRTKTFAELTAMNKGAGTFGQLRLDQYLAIQGAPQCRIVVGYAKPILFVAAELAADACAFEHVYRHELVHVAIYRDALLTLGERVAKRGGDKSAIFEELDSVLPANAAHDSPAEYLGNMSACGGRVATLTGARGL